MEELKEKRVEKQPLEYPSAGSTFKRPEGYFAGKLIMDAGLRGFQVGGAAVSEKHCGFVINKEKATASDVYRLIQEVQQESIPAVWCKVRNRSKMVGGFQMKLVIVTGMSGSRKRYGSQDHGRHGILLC